MNKLRKWMTSTQYMEYNVTVIISQEREGASMKFLIPRWHTNSDEIICLLERAGHTLLPWETIPRNFHYDPVFRREFTRTVAEQNVEAVFSLQYFPIISNICENTDIPYISWCCNDPANQLLLTKSIANSCNIIFHGDSYWAERLQRLGAENIAYLPWAASSSIISSTENAKTQTAADTGSVGKENISERKATAFQSDLSLTDTASPEAWRLYLTLSAGLDRRTKGFLDGLMQAQQGIYGFPFLENALNETVLTAMETAISLPGPRDSIASREELYACQVLYPAIGKREIDHMLKLLAKEPNWKRIFYTPRTEEPPVPFLRRSLPTDSMEAAAIYAGSRINILPAPRDILRGIPPQAMDIMGCGGFLLTSFQSDYLQFFEPGKDYICYESPEDMLDKVGYYLEHEEERREIARRGCAKVMAGHTLELRIREMLTTLNLA